MEIHFCRFLTLQTTTRTDLRLGLPVESSFDADPENSGLITYNLKEAIRPNIGVLSTPLLKTRPLQKASRKPRLFLAGTKKTMLNP